MADDIIDEGRASRGLVDAVSRELADRLSRPLAPGLYLLATPIGNLADVSLRALAVMATADIVYCEDTRHSRKLLDCFGIRRRLRAYHEHNEDTEQVSAVAELARGQTVALLSDAGTPLVSDPGFKLVRAAIAGGHSVFAVPGASAVLAALCASGLPSDTFTFAGFLPSKSGQRQERLSELRHVIGTLLFFEAPSRLQATLGALGDAFGPATPGAVARELTKLHEELRRGSLAELAQWAASAELRGEFVILVAPVRSAERHVSDEEIRAAIAGQTAGTFRDQVDAVAALLRAPRKRVYDIGLQSRKDRRP